MTDINAGTLIAASVKEKKAYKLECSWNNPKRQRFWQKKTL